MADKIENEATKEVETTLFRSVIVFFMELAVLSFIFVGTCFPVGFMLVSMGNFIYIAGLVLYAIVFFVFLFSKFGHTKNKGIKAAILTMAIALFCYGISFVALWIFGGMRRLF